MEDLRLHRCTPADLPRLKKIAEDTFRDTYEAANDPKDFQNYIATAFSEDRMLEALMTPGSCFYFVYDADHIVAYFQVNEWNAQSDLHLKNSLELERIYVLPGSKGKGIGKWILDGVCKMARVKGLQVVWLGVWEKNGKAIDFYYRQGFRKFGEHPFIIGEDEQTDWLLKKEIKD